MNECSKKSEQYRVVRHLSFVSKHLIEVKNNQHLSMHKECMKKFQFKMQDDNWNILHATPSTMYVHTTFGSPFLVFIEETMQVWLVPACLVSFFLGPS